MLIDHSCRYKTKPGNRSGRRPEKIFSGRQGGEQQGCQHQWQVAFLRYVFFEKNLGELQLFLHDFFGRVDLRSHFIERQALNDIECKDEPAAFGHLRHAFLCNGHVFFQLQLFGGGISGAGLQAGVAGFMSLPDLTEPEGVEELVLRHALEVKFQEGNTHEVGPFGPEFEEDILQYRIEGILIGPGERV